MTTNPTPHRTTFAHLRLQGGAIVQLIPLRRRPRLALRRCACGHLHGWRPFRLTHTWRMSVHPNDAALLQSYEGMAVMRADHIPSTDTVVVDVPGVRVVPA